MTGPPFGVKTTPDFSIQHSRPLPLVGMASPSGEPPAPYRGGRPPRSSKNPAFSLRSPFDAACLARSLRHPDSPENRGRSK